MRVGQRGERTSRAGRAADGAKLAASAAGQSHSLPTGQGRSNRSYDKTGSTGFKEKQIECKLPFLSIHGPNMLHGSEPDPSSKYRPPRREQPFRISLLIPAPGYILVFASIEKEDSLIWSWPAGP